MHTKSLLAAWSGLTLVRAQAEGPAPTPSVLSTTQSGVLPILPTPFSGVETIEGAITYDGPAIAGFTGPGGNASIQTNTPGTTYQAVLPNTNFDNATGAVITGTVTGIVPADGMGVLFTVNFTGFPSQAAYGPFVYHVHAMPVPADGNCSGTLGHLDPTDRGELHACETSAPETCQAGDLAGKHGNVTTTSFSTSFLELYLSANASSSYYFGDKSIVIHASNTTRLTCANFQSVSSAASSPGASSVPPTSTGSVPYTGVASQISSTTGAFVSLVAILFSFLL
ncbi:MAG: hypothetical protein M1818_003354 [Claussenomyces sp. TS43310]|nr:MAG: hypothetical protein M1818_003354 [Claussenomyces sp. TS43310]